MRVRSIRSLKSGQPVHARINLTPRGGTPLAPALWWIMKQLLFAREQRKMLLVLTDGQPHDMNATQKVVEIANKIGLEVYGLGMLDRSICCMTFLQGRAGHVYRKTRLEVPKMRICG